MLPRFHPAAERALIAAFLLMLALPGVGLLFGVAQTTAAEENRSLAPLPSVDASWASWAAWPGDFTRYFEDHFAFRPQLVRLQALVRLKALDVPASPSVIKGREGWWFYADDGALEDYADSRPLTAEELETWRTTLQDTSDWLRARGIAYLVVLAPDKHQVYPEYMPPGIRKATHSRLTQLVSYLEERSSVPVLDLRPALARAKRAERVYHRTDTHWNDAGAYVAYREIVAALSRSRPALQPKPLAAFATRRVRRDGLDLARMLRVPDVLQEDEVRLEAHRKAKIVEPRHPNPAGADARIVTESADRSRPRAVIFRDSFGTALVPFLSEHFSRAVYLWQYNVDPAVVEQERPDVVIHELVGRRVGMLTPYNPFAASPAGAPPGATEADRE